VRVIKSKILFLIVGTSLVLSLQGCDQISKLVDHFSSKKTSPVAKAPTPVEIKAVAAKISEPIAKMEKQKDSVQAKPADTAAVKLAPNVLASVGNWTITLAEFQQQEKSAEDLAKQNNLKYDLPAQRLLGMIVEQQLLFQEAQRQNLDKDEQIVKQIDEARKLILSQNLQTKMVEGINITDEEIAQFYEENKQFYYEPAEYKLNQIVVDTEEQANAILGQLAQGANFADIVNTQSKVKADGKFISEDQLAFQKLKDVIKVTDVGKFSSVFQGPNGFYIVKIDEKKGGQERSLEEVKEGIKADLSYLKYLQGLQKLQDKIPVQTNLDLLEAK
jgi:peptidyl-prolyl cis-trans isomerase C